jgi:hypothetical protein
MKENDRMTVLGEDGKPLYLVDENNDVKDIAALPAAPSVIAEKKKNKKKKEQADAARK